MPGDPMGAFVGPQFMVTFNPNPPVASTHPVSLDPNMVSAGSHLDNFPVGRRGSLGYDHLVFRRVPPSFMDDYGPMRFATGRD